MGAPSVGSVVLVRFPFSDLSQTKLRPAVLLAPVGPEDALLVQITSNPYGDPRAEELSESDFLSGSLRTTSFARPGKLFTASTELIVSVVGRVNYRFFRRVTAALWSMLDISEEDYRA